MSTTTQHSISSLYVSFELGANSWKLAFSNGAKLRYRNVSMDGDGFWQVESEIAKAKEKLGLACDCNVVSCYEAGRDGFWIHRFLTELGVTNYVVDASSIEVNRRARRAKTDRVDARKLVTMLIRYSEYGEKKLWKVVNVPSEEAEDERLDCREPERIKQELTSLNNRIKGKLALHGIRFGGHLRTLELSALRDWKGRPLPPRLMRELERSYHRWQTAWAQLREINQERDERLRNPRTKADRQAVKLKQLKAVGPIASWLLSKEFFSWRGFANRRQVGGCAGLTGTPYDSGESQRDQGIGKSGNGSVRAVSIELAWCWIRYQPGSALTQWFVNYVGKGNGGRGTSRLRRAGIVAVARKLLVALWKYLEHDELPEGAVLSI